jgi:SAM-dependent methyltransferase
VTGPAFRRDLYRGTARDYEQFRVPYPRDLTDGLARRAGADGTGRLLDLACGTGQLALPLRGYFREVWAVDQEPDMISAVARQARTAPDTTAPDTTAPDRTAQAGRLRLVTGAAEDLAAPAAAFDLVTIGNAFHRLRRERVAALALRWLAPGRYLALVWADSPWAGNAPWQLALAATMDRWRDRSADGAGRVPAGYEQDRRERPDAMILRDCGFEAGPTWSVPVSHEWTIAALTGFVFSTSVLSRAALGARAAEFAADLRRELLGGAPDGRFRQVISFGCELARRPV